jgi:lipopolysaccharide/colanic/teichoic acid biosynthesis glycosyltransferase
MIARTVDILVAALVLALTAPLLALAAVAIKLTSRGGVLYRQPRAGLHGEVFNVIKLRTMVAGAEFIGAGMAVDAGDQRITRVGALLRRTSIDELPNLVNVLRGEMSLIGPRPTLPSQVEAYDARQRRRLDVKPGITGWAQVNGRASLPWSERIELDIHYVEHRTLRLDALILIRTLRMLATGGGLYHRGGGGFDL